MKYLYVFSMNTNPFRNKFKSIPYKMLCFDSDNKKILP